MKAVAFDLDETLLDRTGSLKEFCRWQATVLLGMGPDESETYVARFLELDAFGSVWKDVVYAKLVCEFSLTRVDSNLLLNNYVEEFCRFCRPRPFAQECVKELSNAGYRLALVSNGPSPFQEKCFKSLKIDGYFDAVIVSGAIGISKPDPRIFLAMCGLLDTPPHECVFIGDNPEQDVEGAAALGMYTVFVPGPISATCSRADVTCDDFGRLPELIATMGVR